MEIATPADIDGLRKSLGISEDEFHAEYGIPRDVLQKWISGEVVPSVVEFTYLNIIATSPHACRASYAMVTLEKRMDYAKRRA